ncbi:MAG: D-alanyl-D-alanine carboxypeptidase/D-alanyl-D-alanine endopeptidase [Planctomycetota bacterium]|jgi:D-alanyl-D-alanine carboxypeptidase/D-alanyl-D-alanine-endopeptidase (penicillin-binding protein 4)
MLKIANQFIILWVISTVFLAGTGLAETLRTLFDRNKQTRTQFGIYAVQADSGRVVYRLNSDTPMIPASNMKLVTTAAAMHYLGSTYTFDTNVGLLGKDLVIVGGGDPLLADPKNDSQPAQAANALMAQIVDVLRKSGIDAVDNIIVDSSFFDDTRVHPAWPVDQLNQWYACEVAGLNFYDNCIHLQVTRSGNAAVFSMTPENTYVHLVNQLRLISKGSSAVGAYRNSTPNKLLIKGKLNQEAGFDVAIENPGGLFASVLRDKLKASGISVQGDVLQKHVKNDTNIRYLMIVKTPIANVLKRSNTDSLGLAAECLVKTISAESTPGRINGQWTHGLKRVSGYLNSLNISNDQYVLDDGSGLSRNNRLSAECLVAVLKDMYDSKDAEMFTASLAVGGEDGTLHKYFKQAPYKGNIIGKTGYISGVRTFSGICKTAKGDILFGILTEKGNGYTRGCINEITKAIFDGNLY